MAGQPEETAAMQVRWQELVLVSTVLVLAVACGSDASDAAAADAAAADPGPLPADVEFEERHGFDDWTRLDTAEGWPEAIASYNVNQRSPQHLFLEPHPGAWHGDSHGAFLFKEVTGDFVATARVRAIGPEREAPTVPWSMAGILARAPREETRATWTPGGENWVYIATGLTDQLNLPMIQSNATQASRSNAHDVPMRAGWIELRIARVGDNVITLYRPSHPGEIWRVASRYLRPDLPDTLQIGPMAHTDASSLQADPETGFPITEDSIASGQRGLYALFDWIRFRRPEVPEELRGQSLVTSRVDESDLIGFLGFLEPGSDVPAEPEAAPESPKPAEAAPQG